MYFTTPRAWDNLPLRLTTEEIRDPYEVIHEYYSAHDMPRARQILNKWLCSTSKEKPSKLSASGLQFFYERTELLIEAAFLVEQLDNSGRKAITIQGEDEEEIDLMNPRLFCAWIRQSKGEAIAYREVWENFPRSLTYKEFLNPYQVLGKFFSFLTLGEWRELLRELFSMGISRRTFLDETLDFDMLGIKKHLEKLIEAGHLIDVREYRQSFYDKIINETNQKKDEA
ncbi:hypothetical protein FHW36_10528 [Chitinophaga polysaccharea]|uniref:Uncharacterized protein n=1 Tax=Chitinophaga polysaccharea TaxID=1293035 RepID=A0A561PN95_9BACT|nr:hypothetical protein [Chitinophaga polysaccharea]TWF39591.1 hypothetical protein FHW36_10528 [Chitinophaga polysaccharea]